MDIFDACPTLFNIFLLLLFFNLPFLQQTQSEPINGVTHTPRKPRCQRLALQVPRQQVQQQQEQLQGLLKNPKTPQPPQIPARIPVRSQLPARYTHPACYSLRWRLQQRVAQRRRCVSSVCHAPTPPVAQRLLLTLGPGPPHLAKNLTAASTLAAALYAHGVFIKVVFILRDIFGAFFALFSFFFLVFFFAPNNKILLTIFSPLLYQSCLYFLLFPNFSHLWACVLPAFFFALTKS